MQRSSLKVVGTFSIPSVIVRITYISGITFFSRFYLIFFPKTKIKMRLGAQIHLVRFGKSFSMYHQLTEIVTVTPDKWLSCDFITV